MAKQMKPGSAMKAKTPSAATTIMNRMFKATNKMKKVATLEGGPAAKGKPVNPATVKNPAWANGTPGYKPSVSISPSTGWMNSAGKPLKSAKRKKATKLERDAVYKKAPKKKVNKMAAACE